MKPVTEDLFQFLELTRCNACLSDRQRPLGFRGGTAHRVGAGVRTRVVACKECHLIFANPMPIPKNPSLLYDTTAEEYFVHHSLQVKRDVTISTLTELEKRTKGRRLLDVGCGQGVVLEVANNRGWEVIGLDISEKFAEFAKNNLSVPVRVGDIATVELDHDFFDVVVVNAILEHLIDPRKVLMKIQRALKPGGLLLIDVPNERGLYYRVGNIWQRLCGRDWVVNLSPTFAPGHLYGFSPRSLQTILRQTGFADIRIRVYQGRNCLPEPRNAREILERFGTSAVMLIADLFGLGDGLQALAQKDEPTRAS